MASYFFFFNDTATTEIYTLSLHDALPISAEEGDQEQEREVDTNENAADAEDGDGPAHKMSLPVNRHLPRQQHRSEEHTSELQSRQYLVCRLLLEKKKKNMNHNSLSLTTCH